MAGHKVPYAHEHEYIDNLLDAVKELQPTALLGLSGQPQTFTKDVVEAMAACNKRPIIFALSPGSHGLRQLETWVSGKEITGVHDLTTLVSILLAIAMGMVVGRVIGHRWRWITQAFKA